MGSYNPLSPATLGKLIQMWGVLLNIMITTIELRSAVPPTAPEASHVHICLCAEELHHEKMKSVKTPVLVTWYWLEFSSEKLLEI
jgi:hypothetical protein